MTPSLDVLPPLRQDLALHAGPTAADGSPTWTLHDPAANRFFELGWPAFELLSRWGLGSAQAVLSAVQRETTLRITPQDLDALVRMLSGNHLLQAHSAQDTARLTQAAVSTQLSPARWLLKHYLFFRVPLVRPMPWLDRLAPHVAWAFKPAFWGLVALCAMLGLALASQRWDAFTHTFAAYANWQGAFAIAIALSAAKVLHELGHAFTAHRHGCRVATMGVAFLVMWPVLYTDTNEAWKLSSRRQRLAIGAAGMLSEIALAAFATLAWAVMPETPAWGPLKAGAFLLATTTWVITLAINASPFMRFDGYFLLADALNLPNLHERSFALARWWLREKLFGLSEPAPEAFAPARHRALIAFALATWLYRLVLFLGIALLVYHVFFKALGVLLMAIELGWFIAMPVWREMRQWWLRREQMQWNHATRRLVWGGGLACVVLLWPWQSSVHAPAVLSARQAQGLYAPYPARLESPLPRAGDMLRQGDTLAVLHSPELAARLALAQAREQQLQWQLTQQPFDAQLMEAGPALRKRWEASVEEVRGLRAEQQRLTLVMPFDGLVVEVSPHLGPGTWLHSGEKLMHVISPQGAKVEAFVGEDESQTQALGEGGVFIPDAPEGARVSCRSRHIDAVQLQHLDHAALASVHGGPVPSQRQADGRIAPLHPTFRIRLDDCDARDAPRVETAGIAVLSGERRSIVGTWIRRLLALLHREASF